MKTEEEIKKEIETCTQEWQKAKEKLTELIMSGNLGHEYREASLWFDFYAIQRGTLKWLLGEVKK